VSSAELYTPPEKKKGSNPVQTEEIEGTKKQEVGRENAMKLEQDQFSTFEGRGGKQQQLQLGKKGLQVSSY